MAASWLDPETSATLAGIAGRHGTPSFVYFPAPMRERLARVGRAFGHRFEVSYAMKCNPNVGLLRAMRGPLTLHDASSLFNRASPIRTSFACRKARIR